MIENELNGEFDLLIQARNEIYSEIELLEEAVSHINKLIYDTASNCFLGINDFIIVDN